MLRSLSIKNIAVIEKVNIDFFGGFNILTGETGAGKSIIIDSINLLKGQRVRKNIIRTGEEKARVDGIFEITDEQREFISEEIGIDADNEIMISREISLDGKNICRIDGTPVTLAMLKSLGDKLVDIHGQHDTTGLISAKTHIGLLDNYGGDEIGSLKSKYKEIHKEYLSVKREIEDTDTDEKEAERRMELLRYQIEEIEMSGIFPGEDDELEERRTVLKNSYKIASATTKAYGALYEGEDRGSAYDMLWTAIKAIEPISDLDKALSEAYNSLNEASDIISQNARFLKDYCDDVESTSGELDGIEERLEEIDTLKRKYGQDIDAVLRKKEDMQNELDSISHSGEKLKELEKRLANLEEKRRDAAQKLTCARKKYAKVLCQKVAMSLTELCMPKVQFDTGFKEASYNANGADDVEFLISANAGESMRPLAEIASGGELSRIMLAIKGVLADCDEEKLLIFDEVDTGVSGAAAQSIGEKLWKTSRFSQVICITHLPQVAAMADNHYRIEKKVEDDRTKTTVCLLDEEERINETARALGGADITDAARENARELIKIAKDLKK